MPGITVSVDIAAPLEEVWEAAADLESHAEWMTDAESIEILSDSRQGVGTTMRVVTRVGPFRTDDVIEVLEWIERERIGVRHTGLVQGTGSFELAAAGAGLTRFTWSERLSFPWFLGGSLTALLAAPVLRAIWTRNLRRLRARLEDR